MLCSTIFPKAIPAKNKSESIVWLIISDAHLFHERLTLFRDFSIEMLVQGYKSLLMMMSKHIYFVLQQVHFSDRK